MIPWKKNSNPWARPMTTPECALVLMVLGQLLVIIALGLKIFDCGGGWT